MQIGFIGLGKMGMGLVEQMLEQGHEVVVWNRSKDRVEKAVDKGAIEAELVEDLVSTLKAPRTIWLMLPAGDVTEEMLFGTYDLVSQLDAGDTVIDGANSRYVDSQKRAQECWDQQINFVDIGVSGGPSGARNGACMMVGGDREKFEELEKFLTDLCIPGGLGYMGAVGSGHFVKMVHNAIEYGFMQALGEGVEMLAHGPYEKLDLSQIMQVWQNGSVIESKLVGLMGRAFEKSAELEEIKGFVNDNGETQWTIEAALQYKIPMSTIAHALFARYGSRQEDSFAMKAVAALRNEFGGHEVVKKT
jgi:6-phosphogluconate dehydrogenase